MSSSADTKSTKQIAMIAITVNDRLGKKVRLLCNEDDTIGDIKKVIAVKTGMKSERIQLKRWYTVYNDNLTLQDYEIGNGSNLELYYQ